MLSKIKSVPSKIKNMSTKKKVIFSCIFILILSLIIFSVFRVKKEIDKPTLTIMPIAPIESTDRNEFTLDMVLSDLPKNLYPAASVAITFDKNKLEFTGIKLGTMMAYGDKSADGNNLVSPTWSCNIQNSNIKGEIDAMYLDMTAGEYAYCSQGFDKKSKNVVLRLGFKLKDSAAKGDSYNIVFKDAVFATVNGDEDKTSLAMNMNTLKTKNCKIAIK